MSITISFIYIVNNCKIISYSVNVSLDLWRIQHSIKVKNLNERETKSLVRLKRKKKKLARYFETWSFSGKEANISLLQW